MVLDNGCCSGLSALGGSAIFLVFVFFDLIFFSFGGWKQREGMMRRWDDAVYAATPPITEVFYEFKCFVEVSTYENLSHLVE